MTKTILALLMAAMLFLIPCVSMAETVVTSFYPIYLFTLNLTVGMDDLEVRNLAAPNTGCLHDYQLQTSDMKALSEADVFLINGAGMESYLSHVMDAFPHLAVVDASEGIPLLAEDSDTLSVLDGDGEPNAHLWLDAANAQAMVNNLAAGLIAAFPSRADAVAANRDAYCARLSALDQELREGLSDLARNDIVTFHEAFPYFARAYGIHVAAVVNREPGDALSPAQLARLVQVVRDLNLPPLFIEPQYDDMAAQTLSRETGAPVYTLDPVVTGPTEEIPLTYYEDVMRQNMLVLQQALNP